MSCDRHRDELHALLEASVDGILIIDHLGQIQTVNGSVEKLFGYHAGELIGGSVNLLMTEADGMVHDAHLASYLSTRVGQIIGTGREVNARRKDGTVFPAWLSVGVIEDPVAPRFVGFLQDMTARRQSEDQTRRLQQRLWHVSQLATVGEMSSGIAHELNQPLAAIANYAQASDRLLARSQDSLEEVREALREITAQAVRAGDIIGRLRSLAHHEASPRELTDVNVLIRQLSALIEPYARQHEVHYGLQLSEGIPAVELQPAQIQQVILALVRNAIEALAGTRLTPREVTVSTSYAEDNVVEISVCDTGPGITGGTAPHLFEPFYTSKPDRTGLGLAISRTVAAQHQGRLDYRAKVPRGACFALRLPRLAD